MPHLNHRLGVSRVRDLLQHAAPNMQLMRALTRVRGRIVELEVLTQELVVLREQRAALQAVIGTPARQYVRIAAALSGGVEPRAKQWSALNELALLDDAPAPKRNSFAALRRELELLAPA